MSAVAWTSDEWYLAYPEPDKVGKIVSHLTPAGQGEFLAELSSARSTEAELAVIDAWYRSMRVALDPHMATAEGRAAQRRRDDDEPVTFERFEAELRALWDERDSGASTD